MTDGNFDKIFCHATQFWALLNRVELQFQFSTLQISRSAIQKVLVLKAAMLVKLFYFIALLTLSFSSPTIDKHEVDVSTKVKF